MQLYPVRGNTGLPVYEVEEPDTCYMYRNRKLDDHWSGGTWLYQRLQRLRLLRESRVENLPRIRDRTATDHGRGRPRFEKCQRAS